MLFPPKNQLFEEHTSDNAPHPSEKHTRGEALVWTFLGFSGAPHGGTCHFNNSPGVRVLGQTPSVRNPKRQKRGPPEAPLPALQGSPGFRPARRPRASTRTPSVLGPEGPPRTLDGPLEEGLAGLAGSHTVVVARGNVPTHEAQALGDGVEHVLALNGRVLHDAAGTVLIALATRGASQPGAGKHGRRVQAIGVGTQGQAKAAAGVGRATGAVVAEGIDARGRAGRLRLDEGATAGAQVPIVCGHPVQ